MKYSGLTKREYIFERFREEHPRGTDKLLEIYGWSKDYAIHRFLAAPELFNKDHPWSAWYRFKRAARMLEDQYFGSKAYPGIPQNYLTNEQYHEKIKIYLGKKP